MIQVLVGWAQTSKQLSLQETPYRCLPILGRLGAHSDSAACGKHLASPFLAEEQEEAAGQVCRLQILILYVGTGYGKGDEAFLRSRGSGSDGCLFAYVRHQMAGPAAGFGRCEEGQPKQNTSRANSDESQQASSDKWRDSSYLWHCTKAGRRFSPDVTSDYQHALCLLFVCRFVCLFVSCPDI